MKLNTLLLFASLATLATSCGQNDASKKLADEAEARVVASIKQVMIQNPAQGGALDPVHTWYQSSEVPNIIKLDPGAEAVYRDHAAILQEVATNETKLASDPILTPAQGLVIRAGYSKMVDESSANVAQLTNLASSKTTMSEAEQRTFVGDLAKKESHELELVKYFTRRSARIIDQKTRSEKQHKYNREVLGIE